MTIPRPTEIRLGYPFPNLSQEEWTAQIHGAAAGYVAFLRLARATAIIEAVLGDAPITFRFLRQETNDHARI